MRAQFERARIAALDSQRRSEAQRELKPLTTVFEPPRKQSVSSLCDWIADNPDFKHSRAYNKLLDAYWEAQIHSF